MRKKLKQRRFGIYLPLAGLLLTGSMASGSSFVASSFYVEPPAVSELISQAAISRVDFIKVTSDMERLAPALVYPEPMFAYINALDELYQLGLGHDMETWGSIPVRGLGYVLTEHALKWFHLGLVDDQIIGSFIRWAKDDTLHIAISSQMPYLLQVKEVEGMLAWHKKIATVVQLLSTRQVAPYVIEAAEQLQGKIVLKLLQHSKDLSFLQSEGLIESLASNSAIQQVAGFIDKRIYGTTSVQDLKQLSQWSLLLGQAIQKHAQILPSDLYDLSGRLFHELLRKYLYCKEAPDFSTFMEHLPYLTEKQLCEFVDLFHNYDWNLLADAQVAFLQDYAQKIQGKLDALGLKEQSIRNKRMLNRFALMNKLMHQNIEGTYKLTIDSSPAVMTILDLGDKTLAASIRIHKGTEKSPIYQDYSFQDVSYDVERDVLELHRVLVEEPRHGIPVQRMYFASLRFDDKGKFDDKGASSPQGLTVSGTFSYGKHLSRISGERAKTYGFENQPAVIADKAFDGFKTVGEFRGEGISLSVSEVGQKAAGVLIFDKYNMQIRLNFGVFHRQAQRLYLTSGELESDRMVQVRGYFTSPDELVISYIAGGEGTLLKSVKLRRI